MVSIELLAIGAILVLQPLIGLIYLFLFIRFSADYVASRAESAVDGRIDRIEKKLKGER